jgi:hypothetical protein
LKDFLSALQKHGSSTSNHLSRAAWLQFLNYAYSDLPEEGDFEDIIGGRKTNSLDRWGWGRVTEALRLEIKALGEHDVFGPFQLPSEEKGLGSLTPLRDAQMAISELAPQWLKLIDGACQEVNSRTRREPAGGPVIAQSTIILFARLCHLMRPQRSINFQTLMGLYLYQGGTRRRVLETLSQLGLTISYRTIQRRMEGLNVDAQRHIRLVGRAPSTTVTWDNFEFTEGRRGERVGDSTTFRSITTALIIDSRIHGGEALSRGMWQPRSILLSATRIASNLYPEAFMERVRVPYYNTSLIKTCAGLTKNLPGPDPSH